MDEVEPNEVHQEKSDDGPFERRLFRRIARGGDVGFGNKLHLLLPQLTTHPRAHAHAHTRTNTRVLNLRTPSARRRT